MKTKAAKVGVLAGFLFGAFCAGATDYWVSPNGTGNYLTRETPGRDLCWLSRNLATQSGDVIHLLEGVHYVNQTSQTGLAPKLFKNVSLIGETGDPTQVVLDAENKNRAVIVDVDANNVVVRNVTIRNGATVYQGGGICTVANMNYQNYSVSNCILENCTGAYQGGGANGGIWRDCIIRGCSVTNRVRPGFASNAAVVSGTGGGVFGGVLYNCVITNNNSFAGGAGIAGGYKASVPTNLVYAKAYCKAYNCIISSNRAEVGPGGGVGGQDGCLSEIHDCWLEYNRASTYIDTTTDSCGGGIAYTYAENCTITNCYASKRYGGGVFRGVCVNSRILGNYADLVGGGGAFVVAFTNCVISGNRTGQNQGGGTYNCTTYNCLVVGNKSGLEGGGHCRGYHQGDVIFFNKALTNTGWGDWSTRNKNYAAGVCAADGGSDCAAVNCTIYYNEGGCAGVTHASLTNTIIWGQTLAFTNMPSPMVNCFWKTGCGGTVPAGSVGCKDALVAGFVGNEGALKEAVQADWKALCLKLSSPCCNAGTNLPWMADAHDILGTNRIRYQLVDIGALECNLPQGTAIMVQ